MHPKVAFLLRILDDLWLADDWIDPLDSLLGGWPTAQARKPFAEGLFSVEEIVNHTAFWEERGRRLLIGESLDDLGDEDEVQWGKAPRWMPRWPKAAEHYRDVRQRLRQTVQGMDQAGLAQVQAGDVVSRQVRIYTRAIHSGYHAGQLSLLRRLYGVPPAEAASQTPAQAEPTGAFAGCGELLLEMMDNAWLKDFSIDSFESLTQDLSKAQADRRPREDMGSITGIVNHMAFWEEYVGRRLRREPTGDVAKVADGQAPAGMPPWPQAREHLLAVHQALRAAVEALSDEQLCTPRPGDGSSADGHNARWLVQGIVIHHAYHVGQIVLMRQAGIYV